MTMNSTHEDPAPTPEQQALRAAKRCEWTGVACLYAVPILLLASNVDLGLRLPVTIPPYLEAPLGIAFFASWLLAAVGFLFRAGELRIEARARTRGQMEAIQRALVLRRGGWGSFVLLLALWCGSSSIGPALQNWRVPQTLTTLVMLALVLGSLAAGFGLTHRAGEIIRRALSPSLPPLPPLPPAAPTTRE